MVKSLKITGLVFLGIIILIGSFLWYDHYTSSKEKALREKKELGFATNVEWEWHNKYNRIQIEKYPVNGKSLLRKVYLKDNYVVYARKNDDRSLTVLAKFLIDCEPNTEITTSQKFNDGTPKKLRCNEEGNALTFAARQQDGTSFLWEENLDGFKIRENFRYWDFTKLDQEITLSKAKKKKDEVIEDVTDKDTAKTEEEAIPEDTAKTEEEILPEEPIITEKELAAEKIKAIDMVKYSDVLGKGTADSIIKKQLKEVKGVLNVTGWKAKRSEDQVYLVTYTYDYGDGQESGYYYEVNLMADLIRDVKDDLGLLDKYGMLIQLDTKDIRNATWGMSKSEVMNSEEQISTSGLGRMFSELYEEEDNVIKYHGGTFYAKGYDNVDIEYYFLNSDKLYGAKLLINPKCTSFADYTSDHFGDITFILNKQYGKGVQSFTGEDLDIYNSFWETDETTINHHMETMVPTSDSKWKHTYKEHYIVYSSKEYKDQFEKEQNIRQSEASKDVPKQDEGAVTYETASSAQEDLDSLSIKPQEAEVNQITPDIVLQKLGQPDSIEKLSTTERWYYGKSYVEFDNGVLFRCYELHGKDDMKMKLDIK